MSRPLIFVTNDDGFTAPGIAALIDSVKEFGDLFIVAPDKPQSGMGHAITVNQPLRVSELSFFGEHQAYSCSGTPVDCVKIGMFKLNGRKPDLIVSGINHGSNCSTNVLYSGTMSAAVEGAIEGVPSIGFSLADFSIEADFTASKHYVKKIVKEALKTSMDKGVCLNVNIPKLPLELIKGIKICRQAKAFWEDTFDVRVDPLGKEYFWLTGEFENFDKDADADILALESGSVSVVPTKFDMTAYESIEKLKLWE
ncbi:MAG: 5'/3'-nucleotidase SurE [Flavobacteriales bacterium]